MVKLGEICDVRDGTHDSPKYVTDGYPLVTSKNISSGEIDFSNVSYISEIDYNKINERSKVDKGDILMPMIGTIGNPIIVNIEPCFTIKNVSLIKFNNSTILNRYVLYLLNSNSFKKYIADKNRGGTQKFISLKDIREYPFILPAITRQQHIVSTLDKLQSIIAHRKQQLAKLDELVKARFVEMFGEIDLTPQRAGWTPISAIGTVIGGSTPKTSVEEYWDGDLKWITPAELLPDTGYLYDSVRTITKAGADSCSLQLLPIDTVILTSRAPIGKVAIAGTEMYCNQGF